MTEKDLKFMFFNISEFGNV